MSAETVTRTAPDPEALQAFAESVVADFKGHQVALMASLGDHLGLFTALAQGPATSTTVARRAGLDERHVREWLAGMTAAEYVCHDRDDDTYHLTPEQAAVFARDDTPASMGGLFHELVGMWELFEEIKQSFTTGHGIGLDAYPATWWDGMERFTNAAFETQLVQEWIPKADGIDEVLPDGARIADIGCGRGRALVKLLQTHPEITAVGFDLSTVQLEGARQRAADAGVEDRVEFRLHDAADGLDGPFDLVTAFDVAHDLVDVDGVFTAIHDALDPEGSFLLVDFDVGDELAENINPVAAALYGFSLVYCLPTSLVGNGDGLGTCGLPPSEIRTRAHRAGFREVQDIPIENPFNRLYQLRP